MSVYRTKRNPDTFVNDIILKTARRSGGDLRPIGVRKPSEVSRLGITRRENVTDAVNQYGNLKLPLEGYLKPGEKLHRNVLFEQLFASLPRDPQVKVQIYNAEIAPGGFTPWHCHNGATFFIVLQGMFEAHFQEGILIRAKAGDVYSEPIAKIHRGHNPHPTLAFLCIGICLTPPDREHVTNVEKPW